MVAAICILWNPQKRKYICYLKHFAIDLPHAFGKIAIFWGRIFAQLYCVCSSPSTITHVRNQIHLPTLSKKFIINLVFSNLTTLEFSKKTSLQPAAVTQTRVTPKLQWT
jgi:hypothetical protein